MPYKHTFPSLFLDIKKQMFGFLNGRWSLLRDSYRTSKITFFVQLVNFFIIIYFSFWIIPELHLEKISPLLESFSSSVGVLFSYLLIQIIGSFTSYAKNIGITDFIFQANFSINITIFITLILIIFVLKLYMYNIKTFTKNLIKNL